MDANIHMFAFASLLSLFLLSHLRNWVLKRFPNSAGKDNLMFAAILIVGGVAFLSTMRGLIVSMSEFRREASIALNGGYARSASQICASPYRRFEVDELCSAMARDAAPKP